MQPYFINGIGSVSIQAPTFDLFRDTPSLPAHLNKAQHPSYKELIAPAMIRRMGSGVKMGIHAAALALKEASVAAPDAIVTGTGLGCVQDSEKFLETMITNDEEFLTPTSFIQSTHNTVGAQIALHQGCKAYNLTYVNGANSFESALLDAKLHLEDSEDEQNVLIGGVDEIAPYTYSMYAMIGRAKLENAVIDFKNPTSLGIPLSEGANFFVISNRQTASTYAKLLDVSLFNLFTPNGSQTIERFLTKNALQKEDIDLVILGVNGDESQQPIFDQVSGIFLNTAQAYYQHISGCFDTASAYGFNIAAQVIRQKELPSILQYNEVTPKQFRRVLLFNQCYGADFSLVLLGTC